MPFPPLPQIDGVCHQMRCMCKGKGSSSSSSSGSRRRHPLCLGTYNPAPGTPELLERDICRQNTGRAPQTPETHPARPRQRAPGKRHERGKGRDEAGARGQPVRGPGARPHRLPSAPRPCRAAPGKVTPLGSTAASHPTRWTLGCCHTLSQPLVTRKWKEKHRAKLILTTKITTRSGKGAKRIHDGPRGLPPGPRDAERARCSRGDCWARRGISPEAQNAVGTNVLSWWKTPSLPCQPGTC